MRLKPTTLLLLLLVLTFAVTAFAGCGGGTDGPENGPGTDSGFSQALSAKDFSFEIEIDKDIQYEGKSSGTPIYEGASCQDLFYAKARLMAKLTHKGQTYTQEVDLQHGINMTVDVGTSTATATKDMTYSVSAAELSALAGRIQSFANGIMSDEKDKDGEKGEKEEQEEAAGGENLYVFSYAIEKLIAQVYPYTPDGYQAFVDECRKVVGDDDIKAMLAALKDSSATDLALGSNLVTVSAPNTKAVTVSEATAFKRYLEDNNSAPLLYSYLGYSDLAAVVDTVNGRSVYFSPTKADFENLGLTLDDVGIVMDERFFALFEEGFTLTRTLEADPFAHTKVDYAITYRFNFDNVGKFEFYFSDLPTPEVEYDFENGFAYNFTYKIGQKELTASFRSHQIVFDLYSQDCEFLPEIVKKYGDFSNDMNSQQLVASVKMPDSISISSVTSVVDEDEFTETLKGVKLTFVYGDRTTVLTHDNFNAYTTNQYETRPLFKRLLGEIRTELETNGGYRYDLSGISQSDWGFCAQETPYVFPCELKLDRGNATYHFNFSVTLLPIYVSASFDTSSVANTYYENDALSIAPGTVVSLSYRADFSGSTESEQILLTESMIEGFDSSSAGQKVMRAVFGSLTIELPYLVKADSVVSIQTNTDFFDLYILNTPIDLSTSFLTATYESGKVVKDIPVDASMLSTLPTAPGGAALTVTYGGVSTECDIIVLEIEEASVYSGIMSVYMVNEKPTEIIFKVKYKANEFGYDEDYVLLPATEYDSFNTATAGSYTWSYTYGGCKISAKYEVLEKIYVGYTVNGESITINGLYMATDDQMLYYELTSCSRIEIPATINGVTVTKIAANAFSGKNMIVEMILPDTVTEIGGSAFRNMTALERINIPNSVTSVGTNVLDGCTALTHLSLPGSKTFLSYFNASNPKVPAQVILTINEGTTALVEDFFQKNKGYTVTKLILPASLTDMGLKDHFDFLNLSVVETFEAAENGYYSIVGGVIFADGGKILYYFPMSKQAAIYMIPEGVETVVFMAANPYLNGLYIPASVKTLGKEVFRENTALSSVTFGGSLEELPYGCFMMCESLSSLTLPTGLVRIGEYAFERVGLDTMVIPNTVTEIGYNAFYMARFAKLAIPASAMSSFSQMGYQCLDQLTEFAYDGSVRLNSLKPLNDGFQRSPLSKIYVYGTTSFVGGITYTASGYTVYICDEVRTITHPGGVVNESSSCTFYYEGSKSNLSSAVSIRIAGYNHTFEKFFE
ncbi:MAG: leucine-rich repeat domain-containing protein [Clostridia bacterium]|nr:leucine-rich repeat domain-containing protein [Clostridia bacterium]